MPSSYDEVAQAIYPHRLRVQSYQAHGFWRLVYFDLENMGTANQTSAVPRYQFPVLGLAQCAAYHGMKVLDGTRGWAAFQLLIQESLNLLRSEAGQLAAP